MENSTSNKEFQEKLQKNLEEQYTSRKKVDSNSFMHKILSKNNWSSFYRNMGLTGIKPYNKDWFVTNEQIFFRKEDGWFISNSKKGYPAIFLADKMSITEHKSWEKLAEISKVPLPTKESKESIGQFTLSNSGVWFKKVDKRNDSETLIKVISKPLKIVAKYTDLVTENIRVMIRYGQNIQLVTKFDNIMWTRKISELTNFGIPISSSNASNIILYLSQYWDKYEGIMPHKFSSDKNGWFSNDSIDCSFRLGNKLITDKDTKYLEYTGENNYVESHGKLSEWLKAFKHFKDDPQALIVMGTAAIAPYLKISNSPSYVVNIWGMSSRSKSIISMLACSMFGNPKKLVKPWKSTEVGCEMNFIEMNNLPVFLDDAQKQRRETVSSVVYTFIQGLSKPRGTIKNNAVTSQKQSTWHTSMVSTSERMISTITNESGIIERVIEIKRDMTPSSANREKANECRDIIFSNYGLLGEKIVRYIIDNQDLIENNYDNNYTIVNDIAMDYPKCPTRHIEFWSSILTGVNILEKIINFTPDYNAIEKCIEANFDEFSNGRKLDEMIYDFIYNLFISNKLKFTEKGQSNDVAIESWGFYEEQNLDDCLLVHFIPSILERELKKEGFSKSDLRFLSEKGLMACTSGVKNEIKVQSFTNKMKVYTLLFDKNLNEENVIEKNNTNPKGFLDFE